MELVVGNLYQIELSFWAIKSLSEQLSNRYLILEKNEYIMIIKKSIGGYQALYKTTLVLIWVYQFSLFVTNQ